MRASRPLRPRVHRLPVRLTPLFVALAVYGLTQPATTVGQATAQADRTINVATGGARLVTHPVAMRRVSVANAEVAEALVVSPNELLLNGKAIGTTSLIIWDAEGARTIYTVDVSLDAVALQSHYRALFPNEEILVTASGNTYILSGRVSDPTMAQRAVQIAEATESMVVNNLDVPAPHQILLQVRFAEVSRTAMQELGANFTLFDPLNPRGDDEGAIGTGQHNPFSGNFATNPLGPNESFSDRVNLFVFHNSERLGVFIRALQGRGLFKSLAEPNLMALDGVEASFLAGGEFPFPVLQGGASDAITVVFKEFGIRLKFLPQVQTSGNIKLKVMPEVSTLDFASGLQSGGFQIPTLLTRRAETEVELRDGQTFAIAGLIDNSITENVNRVPILGHIPILGMLFRSQDLRQNRSELLVLVTPRLVQPSAAPPPIPTGEPSTWDWKNSLERPLNPQGTSR